MRISGICCAIMNALALLVVVFFIAIFGFSSTRL